MAFLAASGCSGGGTSRADSTPSPLPCGAGDPRADDFTVESTGTQPRAPLRYRAVPGRSTRGTVTQQVTVTTGSGPAAHVTGVTATVPYTAAVRAACGTGFTTETRYARPTVRTAGNGSGTAATRTELDLLDGLVVRESRDTRGRLVDTVRSAPAGADPSTRQAVDALLDQLAQGGTVFPDQPVGPGARWHTERRQTVSGFILTSTVHYTLSALRPDTVTLAMDIDVRADRQTVAVQGRDVTLERYTGSGSGTVTVSLHDAVTTAGRVSLTVSERLRTGSGPVDQRTSQVVSLAVA